MRFLIRKLFETTEILLKAIATLARTGGIIGPPKITKTPAAIGINNEL